MKHPPYATAQKLIGETPLEATEKLRARLGLGRDIPLAYAGRLDPMASGTLLILIGDECKKQTQYHSLDKCYEVELLIGVQSDTGDVLGIVDSCKNNIYDTYAINPVLKNLIGSITLPYPHFSSKTVHGKPLHMWAIEKRLNEIEIPTKTSSIHALTIKSVRTVSKSELLSIVRSKIDSIPPVIDPRKHAGADFRRADVRRIWKNLEGKDTDIFQIVSFTCIASSGTYMRSLCGHIGTQLGSCGLALSIHRTTIGRYKPLTKRFGLWLKKY